MKNRFALAVCAALTAGIGSASAADLPYKAPAAPVVAPVFNWTGLYVGVHGGYGWGDAGVNGLNDWDVDGWFLGGQIGFNWQAPGSPLVLGIELDSAWANIGRSESFIVPAFGTLTADTDLHYQGSLRGRIGYAFDRALLYATGGIAWARNEIVFAATIGPFVGSVSDTQSHFGWTLGAGLEYAFAPNWSAKVEYLYTDYDAETYFSSVVPGGFSADADIHTVKLGLNYRFGWGGPVVARY